MNPKISTISTAQSHAMNTIHDSPLTQGKESTRILYGDMQKVGSCSNRLITTQDGQSASKVHVDNILSKLL